MRTYTDESGQGLVEYALILTTVALIALLALSTMGTSLQQVYCSAVSELGGSGCGCQFTFDDASALDSWEGGNRDSFSVENGQACITGNGQNAYSYLNSCATDFGNDNVVINVTAANIDQVVDNGKNTGLDVWFRAQDENNGYHFTYNTKNNFVRIWKRVDGAWIRLAHTNVPNSWDTQANDFEIKVIGDTFQVFREGDLLLQATDDAYTQGKVGLRNKPSSKTCIDGLSVGLLP
ncbi:MAG: hypothetical protein H8E28_03250 [Anaerolineae bacterium]|nr:hypothetical protein [Anaerolineae bacterium]